VALGIALNAVFASLAPSLAIATSHLVQIPSANGFSGFLTLFTLPDFSQLTNMAVYTTAITLAVVASLETLLCVEATDKLDPQKRVTPTDRELKAQGLGNVVSGLVGGLPLTQVIVRSSANIQSGAKSKLSAILHGVLLLAAVVTIPGLLNRIPLSVLAAILLTVGYKLAKPAIFVSMYRQGPYQFAPFIVTVVGILATDLLVGIGLGMAVAVFALLLTNYSNPFFLDRDPGEAVRISLSEDVSFLNRAAIMRALAAIPPGAKVVIDASRSMNIDHDVYEIIKDFEQRAGLVGIDLTVEGLSSLRRSNDAMHRVHDVIARDAAAPAPAVA
jgi:MFS superfamily sulfate permease-like transporter